MNSVREDRAALALYVAAAVTLTFLDHRTRRFPLYVVTDYIPSVIAGSSGAPAKYRVLMPYTIDALARWTGAAPYSVFLGVEFVSILAALAILHRYLRGWYAAAASTGGTLAAAALLPLTFTNSWAHPDTFPDLALFTAGCLLIAERRDRFLPVVLAIATLNRETAGFLAMLWIVHRFARERSARAAAIAAGLVAVCAAVYLGVRYARGWEIYRLFMLGENLQALKVLPVGFDPFTRVAGYFWLVLLAVPCYLAARTATAPGAPPFFRDALAVAFVFLLVAWAFAAIIELRVLVPVIPLVLPGAVGFFAAAARP